MAAVWVRARVELRRRWRATVVLAVLVGLAGGATIAGVAGARRTASAMDRFVAYSKPMGLFVFDVEGDLDLEAVARLPQVADSGQGAYALMTTGTPTGQPDPAALGSISPFVRVTTTGLGATSDLPYLVEGRLADPDQALEVVVNEEAAARHGLEPGATLLMWAYAPEQFGDVSDGARLPEGPALELLVTGIIRLPFDLDPRPRDPEVIYSGRGTMLLGPAFWQQYGDEVAAFGGDGEELDVRLREDADVESFEASVRALPGGDGVEIQVGSESERVQQEAERATGAEAAALVAFAALAGVAGLLVVGQALSREVQLGGGEHPSLLALGMTRRQLLATTLLRASAIAGPGALLAAGTAVAASPLAPIGLARRAEIEPGIAFDVPVVALGAVAVVVAVFARAALAGWRWAPGPAGPDRREQPVSAVADRLAGAGLPPTTVTGVGMALGGGTRGRKVLVGTALAGALAVALGAGALGFGASLQRLGSSPELQGWGWDVVVGNPNDEEDLGVVGPERLAGRPFVEGFTAVSETLEPLSIDSLDVDAAGLELVAGTVFPPLVEGRPPMGPGEVVLGGQTMQRLGLSVGDGLQARLGGQDLSLEVVGQAVLNPAVQFAFSLDEGAVLSLEELREVNPDAPVTHFLVRYREGTDEAAAFATLQDDWGKTVLRSQPPVEVQNLRRVANLPVALAVLVSGLALATLGHALVTSVRRGRGDLAVLRVIGFRGRDLAATLRWQATTLAVAALAIGLPLGVAAGRWAWRAAAGGFGDAAVVTPVPALLLIVAATLVMANLVAALPVRSAARTRPAVALRAE